MLAIEPENRAIVLSVHTTSSVRYLLPVCELRAMLCYSHAPWQ